MKLALDALEPLNDWPGAYTKCKKAVDALRAALAQQAEPDAVLAEREACAKLIESRKTGANELMDAVRDMEAAAIRARGKE
jgi:hypothetical protein